jgi:hypothetical protein
MSSILTDTSSIIIPSTPVLTSSPTSTPTISPMSQTTPTSTPKNATISHSSLSKGASIGVGVGISVGVIAVIACLLWYFSFHERKEDPDVELSKSSNRSVYQHHQNDMVTEYERPATRNSQFTRTIASRGDEMEAPKSSRSMGRVPTGLSPAQQATRAMLTSIHDEDRRNFI